MQVGTVAELHRDFKMHKSTIVGKGGFGHVMKVKRKADKKFYALKVQQKGYSKWKNKNIQREKAALTNLDHPNIIKLLALYEDDLDTYFLLEWIAETDLHRMVWIYRDTNGVNFPEKSVQFYGAELVSALEYMKERGFVHRDIKPENILLTVDFHIKIADFGTCRPITDGSGGVVGDENSQVGTQCFMAPEVMLKRPVTYSTDLWGLAVVLSVMFFGSWVCKPQHGENWIDYYLRVQAKNFNYTDRANGDLLKLLINGLVPINASLRLGSIALQHIKNHPYFQDFAWDNLHTMPPPPLFPVGTTRVSGAPPPGFNRSPIKRFDQPKEVCEAYKDRSIFNTPPDVFHGQPLPPPPEGALALPPSSFRRLMQAAAKRVRSGHNLFRRNQPNPPDP